MYESNAATVNAYNATLTADGDHANGKGNGWMPTDQPTEYRLGEMFTNDEGVFRVEGLPYGQYLVVETTISKDVFQCDPFIVTVDTNSPQSRFTVPTGSVTAPSNDYMTFNVLDEELEGYLQLIKTDTETGKAVKIANTAFALYRLDDKRPQDPHFHDRPSQWQRHQENGCVLHRCRRSYENTGKTAAWQIPD